MTTRRDAVIRKFSAWRSGLRRIDYKGERRRLNLRLDEELLTGLEIIKRAGGADKNTFCAGVLAEAVRARVADLKAKHDAAAWDFIVRSARLQRD